MGTRDPFIWYFAYGSNMHPDVFVARRAAVPKARDRARLTGHRLVFDQPGIPLLEPAFANVRVDPTGEVWGVLWKISSTTLARLDQQEGGGAYTHLKVKVQGDAVGAVDAITYRAGRTLSGLKPSRRYLDLVVAGARDAGLPESYVASIARTRTSCVPLASRVSPIVMRFFERLFVAGVDPNPLFDWYWNLVAWRRSR